MASNTPRTLGPSARRIAKLQAAIKQQQQNAQPARPGRRSAAGNRRILHLSGVSAVPAASDSAGYRLEIPETGTITELRGSVSSGSDPNLTSIRVVMNGIEDLITDGRSGDYAPFSDLFSTDQPRFPVQIPVRRGDVWYVYFRNGNAGAAVTPSVSFFLG